MDERKVTSEELCKALRCSATVMPKEADILTYCKGCPYDHTEKPEKFEMFLAEKDGLLHSCYVDRMTMDAAERIEELTAQVERARAALTGAARVVEMCNECAHSFSENAGQFCEDCCGENFEWKE